MTNYVNAFVEAAKTIIEQVTNLSVTNREAHSNPNDLASYGLAVVIGFTGKIKGSVSFVMEESVVCEIASVMMGGFEVNEIDDMAKSAIGELCNMTAGTSATILFEQDVRIEITPPTIFAGEKLSLHTYNKHVICVPMSINNAFAFELYISFTEN